MSINRERARFSHHGNAFGFLRLLMASAVIVSHAQILRDGDDRREVFTLLFGTVTLGEIAVDGFFAISGFLIAGSYQTSTRVRDYLVKRVVRIYPAFVVATLFCIFVVAPLGGGDLRAEPLSAWLRSAKAIVALTVPVIHAFPNTSFDVLNGAVWTIAFEFRCYLLVIVLGAMGLLRRPWALAALAAALLLLQAFAAGWLTLLERLPLHGLWLGQAVPAARLFGIFMAGAALHAFGDRVAFTLPRLAIAAVLLTAGLPIAPLPSLAFGLFGTYLVLGIAFRGRGTWLERVNNRNDISYGVYLYAWPITKLLLWYWHGIPVSVLMLLTFAGSLACGWASWHAVEKPVLEWARARMKRRRPAPVPAATGES